MKKNINPTKKNIKPTTKPKDKAKNDRDKDNVKSPWIEDYLDCFSFTFKPVTQMFIDRISQEYITWAKNDPDALDAHDFHYNKNINAKTFYNWRMKFPQLKEAHEFALHYIGARRDKGTLKREFAETSISKAKQLYYDPVYRQGLEEMAKMKEEGAIAQAPQFVVIPSVDDLKKIMKENE